MPTKPVSRSKLIELILDPEGDDFDRAIAARALIRGFPSVLKNLCDVVELVTKDAELTPGVFDLLADAHDDVHPREKA
jgi:hypothetical protein